ncbi:MAG TPA: two-component sensor histidine kinase [Planctomycetes bacterium]|nr:two-component sensor histidine kinase [Planctomycetota bacterium]
MLPFVSGFILAVILAFPALVLFYRRNRKRLNSSDAEHQRRLEELSRLTGGLAHEIKNPLSTIKVNLRLIAEEAPPAHQDSPRWLRKIAVVQKETDRLAQILDDFLCYIGKYELKKSPVDVNELISEMVDFYTPQARTNNVRIRLGLADTPLVCKIDRDMVKQLVLNLFINAVQAMPSGGELIIRTRILKKSALIEISDTGCGIEPDKTDKIFDAYYTSKPGGSGLGLSTARKIAMAHNGSICVDSEVGRGTCFTISLPIQGNH